MERRVAAILLALSLSLALGCAGPSKLAQNSEKKLASGQHWRAWDLATRALVKEPGNPRARSAATAAATAIAQDWERRIGALADVDSLGAAVQVLEFTAFRAGAARYTNVPLSPGWTNEEQTLRRSAARFHYRKGTASLESRRPKKAFHHFSEAERFVPEYRDAAKLASRAYEKALTRVAIVPFRTLRFSPEMARDLAVEWKDQITRHLDSGDARFTRITGMEAIERNMTVAQLDGLSRVEAVRMARKAGADRVVWGSIGGVESDTRLHVFKEVIARRVVEKDPEGRRTVRWTEVPVEVIARVRTASADIEYEVIATREGGTLAHRRDRRTAEARVVWTAYSPEGDLGEYSLVSEPVRTSNPDRARQIETRWKSVCGESTTLKQVLEARRSTRGPGKYDRDVLPRFIAGAAFVFLEELPPAADIAFAALAGGWRPLREDLQRLDAIDEVDLGVPVVGEDPSR